MNRTSTPAVELNAAAVPTQRRLLWSLLPANVSVSLIWGAVPNILLATQVQRIDESAKAGNLALALTLGALCAMIAQPVAGMISDRTRSRFGRRTPWIVGGSLVGGVALIALGTFSSVLHLALAWAAVQIAFNFAQAPLSAVMPDRVPVPRRGTFSAVTGAGLMLGMLSGGVAAALMVSHILGAYVVLAGLAVVVLTLFVVLNPDRSNLGEPKEPLNWRGVLSPFWVNPHRYPDFAWAFSGRFLINLGYAVVSGYHLFIMQDYIGLGSAAVTLVPLMSVVALIFLLLATLVAGPMSDRIGRRKIFVIVAALLLAGALMIPWAIPTLTGMMLYAAVAGFGLGIFQSVDAALITEVLPSESDVGKDLGVINIAVALPQTLAPNVAGAVVVLMGYAWLFPVGIALVLASIFCTTSIRSVR